MTGELSGVVGKPVAVQVRLDDEEGRPLGNYPVRLTPANGSGSVSPTEVRSDGSGVVSVQWTLGTAAGPQSLVASAGAQSLTLTATALPDVPASLTLTVGSGQTGTVGDPLSTAPTVRVRDQYQNGVPAIDVAFTILSGGGSLSAPSARTNAIGDITVPWILGPTLGEQAVGAQVAGLEPLRITANALPGPPARVTLISGGGQTGTVGKPLATPLVFEARDRFGNLAVAGRLELRGDGTASPSPATVGSDGRATTTWTMGTRSGAQTMRAIAGTTDSAAATGAANAGPPSTATRVRGDGQRGWAGGVLADSLTVLVKDEYENPVPAVDVAFVVTNGGGTTTPSSPTTRANGEARAAWRLGSSVGANGAEARVANLAPISFAATATSGPPASITSVSGEGQTATVGAALANPVVLRVRDAFGNNVQGAQVQLEVAVGGGSISAGNPVTDSVGLVSFTWTLGTRSGGQAVRARAGDAPVAFFNATANPGPAQSMIKTQGDGQFVGVGRPVPVPPAVQVQDRYNNGVPGVAVTFAVSAGGGSVAPASVATDGSGVARAAIWTVGSSPGRNALSATSAGLGSVEFTAEATNDVSFGVEVVWVGAQSPAGAFQSGLSGAASRWQSVIAGDLENALVTLNAGACGIAHPAYADRPVDDLLVLAEMVNIDGPGKILGQATSCVTRGNGTTVVGVVRVDAADAGVDAGVLASLATHELGHVMGIGVAAGWYARLVGGGGADPYFNGAAARSRYSAAGGALPNPVPVEAGGGSGTRDVHWRESNMGRELMTGFIQSGANPLSTITIGALADLGYPVNYGAGDGYSVGPAAPAVEPSAPIELLDDVMRVPIIVLPH